MHQKDKTFRCLYKHSKFHIYENEPINLVMYKNPAEPFFLFFIFNIYLSIYLSIWSPSAIYFFQTNMMNNRFHYLFVLLTLLVLFADGRTEAIQTTTSFSSPSSTVSRQVFRPSGSSSFPGSQARDLESEKRRVPTGSNPLHNKRRWINQNIYTHIYTFFNLFSLC